MSQIDYIKDLTIIAIVGESGFRRVIAIGEYLLDEAKNVAEIAFSVNRKYQAKGIGRILMLKLSEAARENGIAGFIAYTSPQNQAMIRLFKNLPYKTTTIFDGDVLSLSCRFDELK